MRRFLVVLLLFLSCLPELSFASEKGVRIEVLTKTVTSWNGDVLPGYPVGQPQITVLRIVVPPHTRLPIHKHPVINAGVILRGRLTVKTLDGKAIHLKAGDSIVEVVNTWHYGENESDESVELIVFYAGVKGLPITILEDSKER